MLFPDAVHGGAGVVGHPVDLIVALNSGSLEEMKKINS